MWTNSECSVNRRAFLRVSAGGLGSLALSHLLGMQARAAENPLRSDSPLAPKAPHHKTRATAVICLFQHSGPSPMDLFAPTPALNKPDMPERTRSLAIP